MRVYRVPNTAEEPARNFTMEPEGQLASMRKIREAGLDLTATNHSHPRTSAEPSARDLALAAYPGSFHVIVSLAGEGHGTQRVLVRADLLIAPGRIVRTSFQLEYLPSGVRCTGRIATVHARAFTATCRLPTGGRRYISAQWEQSETSEIPGGRITSHG